jgi:prohibitin 2
MAITKYEPEPEEREFSFSIGTTILMIVFAVIGVVILIDAWYTIGAGERGIVLTLGKPTQVSFEPGFHLKIPLVQSVIKMNVQTQKYNAEKSSAASKDLQTVTTDIAVNYHILPANVVTIYTNIGRNYQDIIIQPAVQEVVKSTTAKYNAEELITERPIVKDEIDRALRERLAQYNIIVDAISITNFDFSPEFNAAIEQKVTTQQNALAAQNKLAQVEFEAQQRIAQADGEAKAIQIQTDALNRIGGQNYLTLQWISKWNGQVSVVNGGNPIVDLRGINNAGYIATTNSTQ